MTRTRRRTTLVAAALAVLALAAGCSDDTEPPQPTLGEAPAWPARDASAATDGLVWATGSTVHLPDGSTIELDEDAGTYVVAGSAVYYVADGGTLLRATPDEPGLSVPAHPESLRTSADGRWLGLVDVPDGTDGPREVVVVDTTTGTEVVRSQEGLVPGDTDGLDWEAFYADNPVEVVSIVDDTAYVAGVDDDYAWDLATGESTVVDDVPTPVTEPPWWNPSRTWSVPRQPSGDVTRIAPASGRPVRTTVPDATGPGGSPDVDGPALEEWRLVGWLDDGAALALTPSRDGFDSLWDPPVLLTCAVPSGACEVLPGTEDGVALPADRPTGLPPVYPG